MSYNAGCPQNMHMVPSEQNSPQYPRSFTLPRDAGVIVDTVYGPVLVAKDSVPSDNFSESNSNQIQVPSLINHRSSSSKVSNGSGGPTFDEDLPDVLDSHFPPSTGTAVPRMRHISSAPPACRAMSSSDDVSGPALKRFGTSRSDAGSLIRFATTRSDDTNLDNSPPLFAPPLFLPHFSETQSPSMIYTPTLVPMTSPNIAVSPGHQFLVPMTPVFCPSPSISPAASPNFTPMSMPHVQPVNFSLNPTHFQFAAEDPPRMNAPNACFGAAGSAECGNPFHYDRFVELGPRLLDRIQADCIREGYKCSRKDTSEIHQLRQEMIENFRYWNAKDPGMIEHYIEVVHSMASLIASEAKRGKKPLHQLAHRFRTCSLPYLRRENFETRGALELGEYDMRRAVLLYIRLFKNIQLMRFRDFRCTLRSQEGANVDNKLQGKWVVRNRCKRLESFSVEAHGFDEFMYDFIMSGQSGVVDMFVSKDHKPQQAKHKHKERVIGGLLIYFVCNSNQKAEQLLRRLVTYCEGGHTMKEHQMRQNMFRKHQSKKCNPEEDFQKRQMLASKTRWSASDFEMQKKMYHFTLAVPDDDTRKESSSKPERLQQPSSCVRITSISPSPLSFRVPQSSTQPISRPRSRRGSFDQSGVGSAGF